MNLINEANQAKQYYDLTVDELSYFFNVFLLGNELGNESIISSHGDIRFALIPQITCNGADTDSILKTASKINDFCVKNEIKHVFDFSLFSITAANSENVALFQESISSLKAESESDIIYIKLEVENDTISSFNYMYKSISKNKGLVRK